MEPKEQTKTTNPTNITHKFYVEMGKKHKHIVLASNEDEASIKFLNRVFDSNELIYLNVVLLMSESGFDEDIKKYGTEYQKDNQQLILTRCVCTKMMEKETNPEHKKYLSNIILDLIELEQTITGKKT